MLFRENKHSIFGSPCEWPLFLELQWSFPLGTNYDPSVPPSAPPFIHPSVHPTDPSIYLSIHPSIHPSARPSVRPIHQSINAHNLPKTTPSHSGPGAGHQEGASLSKSWYRLLIITETYFRAYTTHLRKLKRGFMTWTGFKWFRIGPSGRLFVNTATNIRRWYKAGNNLSTWHSARNLLPGIIHITL
jgi:hypothetical protein